MFPEVTSILAMIPDIYKVIHMNLHMNPSATRPLDQTASGEGGG
jgi:hypothetical protein